MIGLSGRQRVAAYRMLLATGLYLKLCGAERELGITSTVRVTGRQRDWEVVEMATRAQVGREPKELTKELAAVPKLIAGIVAGHGEARLTWRPDEKTWSVSDVLAHLRSSAEIRGKWIVAILDSDNPTLRAVSPRSAFKKYVDRDVAVSLKEFAEERSALVKRLRSLNDADWKRTLTFKGASPRSTVATVTACAWGLVQHEIDHLDQFRALLSDDL